MKGRWIGGLRTLPHLDYSLENIIRLLDYGYYTSSGELLSMGVENWMDRKIRHYEETNGQLVVERDGYGKLVSWSYEDTNEQFKAFESYEFIYDGAGKLESIERTSSFLSLASNIGSNPNSTSGILITTRMVNLL